MSPPSIHSYRSSLFLACHLSSQSRSFGAASMTREQEANLHRAATSTLGGNLQYSGFVPVTGMLQGEAVWQGVVSIYAGAKGRVYAWATEGPDGPQYVTVLHEPPVTSPFTAVDSWLESGAARS